MSKGLLDPKVDFVFKNIFGSEKNPEILISFLNAKLKCILLRFRSLKTIAMKKTCTYKKSALAQFRT